MSDPFFRDTQQYVNQIYGDVEGQRKKLRRVARCHRWIIFMALMVFLTHSAGFIGVLSIVGFMSEWITDKYQFLTEYWFVILATASYLIFYLSAIIASYLLIIEVGSREEAITTVVLLLVVLVIPCWVFPFAILLYVHQKAVAHLRRHGVRIGFLGVHPSKI